MTRMKTKIYMKVSEQEAEKILSRIHHSTFRWGLDKWWRPKYGTAQRICWLFCWGNKNWKNQADTTKKVREAFDAIFNKPYDWFEQKISLEQADIFRYMK